MADVVCLDHSIGDANLLGSEYSRGPQLSEFVPRPARTDVHPSVWSDGRSADDLHHYSELLLESALIDLRVDRAEGD
jgi:hypothetical protein